MRFSSIVARVAKQSLVTHERIGCQSEGKAPLRHQGQRQQQQLTGGPGHPRTTDWRTWSSTRGMACPWSAGEWFFSPVLMGEVEGGKQLLDPWSDFAWTEHHLRRAADTSRGCCCPRQARHARPHPHPADVETRWVDGRLVRCGCRSPGHPACLRPACRVQGGVHCSISRSSPALDAPSPPSLVLHRRGARPSEQTSLFASPRLLVTCSPSAWSKGNIDGYWEWTCRICEHLGNTTGVCSECGVRGEPGQLSARYACPRCTFHNRLDGGQELREARCAMCTSALLLPDVERERVHVFTFQTGLPLFLEQLEARLAQLSLAKSTGSPVGASATGATTNTTTSATAPVQQPSNSAAHRMGGVTSILQRTQDDVAHTTRTMENAFTDFASLMRHGEELIRISAALRRSGQESAYYACLRNVGLLQPITKDSTSSFVQDVASQLAEFLGDVMAGSAEADAAGHGVGGGRMALVDAYCLYNRARGVSLLSPHEFLEAVEAWEPLHLPFRKRTLASGLVVVEATSAASLTLREAHVQRTLELVRERCGPPPPPPAMPRGAEGVDATPWWGRGVSVLALCDELHVHPIFAEEYLSACEAAGTLIRDEAIEGLTYWPNFILHPQGETTTRE